MLQIYYWVTGSVTGWKADDECEKVSGGRLAQAVDKDTFDFFVNTLHPDHNRKPTNYRVAQLLALGRVDFDLGCYTILPTCSATSAIFPSAQVELGRGWNIPNQSQPNPSSPGDGPPCT